MGRHEKGTQDPNRTLKLGSGSRRDLATLMIAALRSLGIAARFVSGYLNLADDDDAITGGNTHAWVQVYVPGPGWVDFDPSSGVVGVLLACSFASYSKFQLTFINYLFARSALDAIPDCAAWPPEQADNGVRAGPRATLEATSMVIDLLADLEGMCGFSHPTV
jgi:hypothetical protein